MGENKVTRGQNLLAEYEYGRGFKRGDVLKPREGCNPFRFDAVGDEVVVIRQNCLARHRYNVVGESGMSRLDGRRSEYVVSAASRAQVKRKAAQFDLAGLGFEPEPIQFSEATGEFYQWWRRPKLAEQHEVSTIRLSATRDGLKPMRTEIISGN